MLAPTRTVSWLVVVLMTSIIGGVASTVWATSVFNVVIDTTPLLNTAAQLAFEITSGDPTANMVTVTNFSTDGSLGTASTLGGPVLGVLPDTTITIEDDFFFNQLLQPITLGTTITFTLALTQNRTGDPFFPDQFALFLLDADPVMPLPLFMTSDPTADAIFVVDITGMALGDFQVFTPTSPVATVRVTTVPEPSSLLLVAIGIVGLASFRRRQRRASTEPTVVTSAGPRDLGVV